MKFIAAEIARFSSRSGPSLGQWDGLCWIPHPTGGHILIGREADRRIDRMVVSALNGTTYARRIDAARVKSEFKKDLSDLLHREASLDGQLVQKRLAASVKRAAKDCRERSHFLPAHLMRLKDPAPFTIGNVNFWPSKQFVEDSGDAIAAMVVLSSGQGRPIDRSQKIADEAVEYYRAFGWVIDVTIDECDAPVAKLRAQQTAAAAVNIIRLLGSDRFSQGMSIGGFRISDTREAHLWKTEAQLEWSLHNSSLGAVGFDGWLEWLDWPANAQVLEAAGVCLEAVRSPACDWPVALRWIDAVSWFGLAVQDASDAAAVIKFVTAIERMVMTGEKGAERVHATFCKRAAAAVYAPGDDLQARQREAAEIYDARSKLAHGSLSPFAPEVRLMRHHAAEFARTLLVSAGAFLCAFGHLQRPTTAKRLGAVWEELADNIAANGGEGVFVPVNPQSSADA